MNISSKKLGFWPVFGLVTGSQIGSAVFILPASLAPFGFYGLLGWLISGVGAIALALVFADLCGRFPETGGPHTYVDRVFGKTAAFFTGWTYWMISWVSSTIVVIACAGYLSPLIGNTSKGMDLALELFLVVGVTALNFLGVKTACRAEFYLTILKFIPLILVPVAAFFFFQTDHFQVTSDIKALGSASLISKVTLLTLWGFVGLECATVAAGSIENPSKTIPKAIVIGTISVAALYCLNSLGIIGVLPQETLIQSKAPYVDVATFMFGQGWNMPFCIIASIVCLGTLNAWTLSSAQVALGLGQEGFFPNLLSRQNARGAPIWSLIISSMGICILLISSSSDSFVDQISAIIDTSVTCFLFVYGICSLAYVTLLFREKKTGFGLVYGLGALGFVGWILSQTTLSNFFWALLFPLAGIPIYVMQRKIFLKGEEIIK
jgi:APA family basic amino acid/polyamine antiporter